MPGGTLPHWLTGSPFGGAFGVFFLFIDPIGAGIPAGVLLARHRGIGWLFVSFLYFLSDVLMACVFEPMLKLMGRWAAGKPRLAKFAEAYRAQLAKTAAQYGSATGPVALTLVAFGVDPMTARTAGAAAGYGFVPGWTFAITGDMFYFWLIAYSTVKLSKLFGGDPTVTISVMLLAMMFAPGLFKKLKNRVWPSKPQPTVVPIERPTLPR